MQLNVVYDIRILKFFQHEGDYIPRLKIQGNFCEGDIYQVMDTGTEFLVGRGSSFFNTFDGGYPMKNITAGVDYEYIPNPNIPPMKTQITPKMKPRLKALFDAFKGGQYFDYNDAFKVLTNIEPNITLSAVKAFVFKASGEIENRHASGQMTIIKKERYYKNFLTKHDDITRMPQSYQDDWKRKKDAMESKGQEYTYSPVFYSITENNMMEYIKYFG